MLAFLFPGQGSQTPGMGAPWVDDPAWSLVEQASDASGRDVAALLLDADADELTETRNSQLATFVLSMVMHGALTERTDARPEAVAGHSLGEYSALCAADALTFADAVTLVTERGNAMQDATAERPGTMAAVLGLDEAAVAETCETADGDVWVANDNAPGQIVIAGDPAAIDNAAAAAKALGAKRTMALPVGGAFHTPFMASAQTRLVAALANTEFTTPNVPVVANVDATAHHDAEVWADLLGRQLCSQVRWTQSLQTLETLGADTFVEVGPGAVLTGTVKRTVKAATRHTLNAPSDLDAIVDAIR